MIPGQKAGLAYDAFHPPACGCPAQPLNRAVAARFDPARWHPLRHTARCRRVTVPSVLRRLRHWLDTLRLRRSARHDRGRPEASRLVVGSTGSGKSEGELVDLARLAERGDHAVVLLDGHGPLAFRAAGHWIDRGHEERLVYEPLDATDRVLCWPMLARATAGTPSDRRIEDAQVRDEVAQSFLAQRNIGTLSDRPWTREWLEAAIDLCLSQPEARPLPALLDALRTGSPECERLLRRSDRPELVEKFRGLERLRRRSEVQYEAIAGAARRLVEPVCDSEVVRLRSRPGPFDWPAALRRRSLVVFDGGRIRSTEVKRTLFLLASMQVIHAVRRHFAPRQEPLPVVLVLEEAGATGLVTPFVLLALKELRKAGLAIHLVTQSSLDFGDAATFELILSNTPWQAWYQSLAPADQEVGARALANATFDPLAVHFVRNRPVAAGTRRAETASRGESYDAHHQLVRRDYRAGAAHLTTYERLSEPWYKSPQLWEQEYRTRLATLRVGERLVRDRGGVRRERVRPLTELPDFDDRTRSGIGRVRSRPIYLTPDALPSAGPSPPLPDAAARLRQMA